MPPKAKVTKEQIIAAGLDIVRSGEPEALNARAVAARLDCSTQPVFSNYASMEALQNDVLAAAEGAFQAHLAAAMTNPAYPPYKAMGMGYVDFARREPALYRWLFMRDRTAEGPEAGQVGDAGAVRLIMEKTGLTEEAAGRLHLEMWIFVHGLGAMAATGYAAIDMDAASAMLTDIYQGLLARHREAGGHG